MDFPVRVSAAELAATSGVTTSGAHPVVQLEKIKITSSFLESLNI